MNEHFGCDENDYRKYDLLEQFSREFGWHILVVWMKTNRDRSRLGYLEKEYQYKKYNPPLFAELKRIEAEIEEEIARIGTKLGEIEVFLKKVSSGFDFVSDPFTSEERSGYFNAVAQKAGSFDLIFCDPDTGILSGTTRTRKLITFDDLRKIWKIKKNILVYQSYRRKKGQSPQKQIEDMVALCKERLGAPTVIPFESPYMYLLLITEHEREKFDKIKIIP